MLTAEQLKKEQYYIPKNYILEEIASYERAIYLGRETVVRKVYKDPCSLNKFITKTHISKQGNSYVETEHKKPVYQYVDEAVLARFRKEVDPDNPNRMDFASFLQCPWVAEAVKGTFSYVDVDCEYDGPYLRWVLDNFACPLNRKDYYLNKEK